MNSILRCLLLLAVLAPAGAIAQTDAVPNYAVTTNGDTLRADVELKEPVIGHAYVEVDGERREIEEFSVLHLDGETHAVVDGRRLARLVVDGPVRLYSQAITALAPTMMIPGPNGVMRPIGVSQVAAKRIGYVQTQAGPVVEATDAALRDALRDNETSIQHLDRARRLRQAARITTGVGAATLLVGTALSFWNGGFDGTPRYWLVMLGGAAVATYGSQGLTADARSARRDAVKAYSTD